jgi:hypothetical protein
MYIGIDQSSVFRLSSGICVVYRSVNFYACTNNYRRNEGILILTAEDTPNFVGNSECRTKTYGTSRN